MAGGWGNSYVLSTEVYSTSQMKWEYGVPLPSARLFYSNGISVLNDVFLLGKKKKIIFMLISKSRSCKRSGTLFKSLLFWLAGWRSELAGCRSALSMSKIKVRISETKFRSFYKTLHLILDQARLLCGLPPEDYK